MTEPGIDYMLTGFEQLELAATILVIILVIILYLVTHVYEQHSCKKVKKKNNNNCGDYFSMAGEPSPCDLPFLPVSAHFYRLSGIPI